MKKLLFLFVLFLSLMSCSTETETKLPESEAGNFALYPTTNLYNFLKLDTRNGVITQVQYTIEEPDKEFEISLNNTPLAPNALEPGRFTLTPTQNMWTFILLDSKTGAVWHVQWNFDADKRFIQPIKSAE